MLGALTTPDTPGHATLEPKQLFFTSSGRIGVIMDMSSEISIHITELQRNMSHVVHGAGGHSHTKYVSNSSSSAFTD